MTLYSTAFGEYATGSQPSDWTEQWRTTYAASTVELDAGSLSGRNLKAVASTNGRWALSWNDISALANVEILVRVKRPTDDQQIRIIARGAGSGGSETGYLFILSQTNTWWGKFVSGTSTTLDTNTVAPVTAGMYWLRARLNGTAIKWKCWKDNTSEPANWDIEATDTSISASGWVGIGISGGTEYCDYFTAETSSGSWPIPMMFSMEDFSLNLAVQANAFDYLKMILDVVEGFYVEDFPLNLNVVAQMVDSFKMLLEVVLNKLDDFKMLLEVTDGTVFDNFKMLLDVVDGTVFDNFKMELSVVSATPAFRSVTAHRVSSVLHEV